MAKQQKITILEELKYSLTEYLSQFSTKRNIDKVIIGWYQKIDCLNPKKTKNNWDELIKKFYSEVDK
jgi:hypothetical protein